MEPNILADYIQIEKNEVKEGNWGDSSENLSAFYNGVRRASNALGGEYSPKNNFMIEF